MNLSTKKIIIALTSLAFAITMIISISYNNRTNKLVAANAEALAKVDFIYGHLSKVSRESIMRLKGLSGLEDILENSHFSKEHIINE